MQLLADILSRLWQYYSNRLDKLGKQLNRLILVVEGRYLWGGSCGYNNEHFVVTLGAAIKSEHFLMQLLPV